MAMRITGMNSGLDTESIIAELVKVQKTKVDTIKKDQTALQWKQDAWKELNTKALKLFDGALNKMRFTDAYSKKTTKVSNSSAVSVVTGEKAVNGTHELQVKQLAKPGYLTGAQLSRTGAYSEESKLSDVTGIGADESLSFSVTVGGKATEINLTGESKISDVVKQLKNAGVNANFDTVNQRFFISAKANGEDADFALTANDENGFKALTKLGINYKDKEGEVSQATKQYQKIASMTEGDIASWIDTEVNKKKEAVQATVKGLEEKIDKFDEFKSNVYEKYNYNDSTDLAARKEEIVNQRNILNAEDENETEEGKAARLQALAELDAEYDTIGALQSGLEQSAQWEVQKAAENQKLADDDTTIYQSVKADVDARIAYAQKVVAGEAGEYSDGATRILGQDAKIILNGAEFTSTSNTFSINGLTITANQETGDEKISMTTQDDTDGIYDMIKSFIKEYNVLINEMDKLYNAASAKDYKPLTDEEKEAMTDTDIEKWESKIKDSLLRRDSSLSKVSNTMKSVMMDGVTVNGKKMYLSSFGIETLSYFTAADNEKNAYHIYGDEEDTQVPNDKADMLKGMIASDPSTVTAFFSGLTKNLYDSMNKIFMESNDDTGRNSLYNDKRMKSDYDEYTKKIAKQEAKVTAMEDKYYRQFAAMETALAKMQSSQSAISGLLGG